MKPWIKIHNSDNVVIALQELTEGTEISEGTDSVILLENIDKGHKVALRHIAIEQNVIKYGAPIGHAVKAIQPGQWIHSHNLKTNLNDEMDYQFAPATIPLLEKKMDREVQLYRRDNGEVGIRNELWVIPTVGCVNGMAKIMVDQFLAENPCHDIDGVYVFPHQFGCSQLGDDHLQTRTLLQNMAQHPNAGGVLVVGLGCENNQISTFQETLGEYDENRVKFLITQQVEDEISEGVTLLEDIYSQMREDQRESGALSEVRFGLECGGSDGLSGITANPLLGLFSDYLTTLGGTTVLTEVPEMFGAETLLMERSENQQVFDQIVKMVNGFKRYYISHNQPVYENPSPGNKKGGITTLEEKSLGCTQKSGQNAVKAVVDYGERISTSGLNLLNAPGNDAIATSALGSAGCQIVLFTTGRGTPYGGFVPTFKLATNSELAQKKKHWIDFDAGQLVSSEKSLAVLCEELIDKLVAVVNGEQTRNEYHQFRELAVWKNGVTL